MNFFKKKTTPLPPKNPSETLQNRIKITIPVKVVMTDGRPVRHAVVGETYEGNILEGKFFKTTESERIESMKTRFLLNVNTNGLYFGDVWYSPNNIKMVEFGETKREVIDKNNTGLK